MPLTLPDATELDLELAPRTDAAEFAAANHTTALTESAAENCLPLASARRQAGNG